MIQAPDKNKQLIFNTDFEYQYTSNDLKELCNKFKITQSFSKKGCPYYNACIESFHSSIKKEEIYRNTYQTFEEANIAILKVGITEEGCTLLLIIWLQSNVHY